MDLFEEEGCFGFFAVGLSFYGKDGKAEGGSFEYIVFFNRFVGFWSILFYVLRSIFFFDYKSIRCILWKIEES